VGPHFPVSTRIDHVGLNLPERSFEFWQEMLEYLGFTILPDGTHFDAVTDAGAAMICVTATKPPFGTGYHRKDTGLGHLAIRVASRTDAGARDPRGARSDRRLG
jgi:hypothetical protein